MSTHLTYSFAADRLGGLKIKVAKTRFTTLCFNELVVKQSHIFVVQGIRFFSIGNSRLNCQIMESIFDMSLVYLHAYMCACSVVHVTRICCFEFRYLEFLFGYLKFATSNFALSNFWERSWIFRFEPYEKSFENSMTFHGKFARTKDKFRRISFALLLHDTVSQLCVTTVAVLKGRLFIFRARREDRQY